VFPSAVKAVHVLIDSPIAPRRRCLLPLGYDC
jgi:hypothetical protein